jgi:flavodoxin I
VTAIGLFFGSNEGNTESVAKRILDKFPRNLVNIHDIADVTQMELARHDFLILGISTWDFGQIQSDWEEFWDDLKAIDFNGKIVALFGLGDQFGYGDYFVDAMGMLHDVVVANGATIVGYWPAENYEFDASKAYLADKHRFVGLAIDEDQQEALTEERIERWCRQIQGEFERAKVVV